MVRLARRPQEPDRARAGEPAEGPRRARRIWSASASCSTTSRRKRDLVQLLGLSESADGVRIFIGSENKLFSLSGSSLIVAPFHDEQPQGRRRARRHRPNTHQLCPHHSHGRLHRQAR